MIEYEVFVQLGLGGAGLFLMYKIAVFRMKYFAETHNQIVEHLGTISVNLAVMSENVRDLRSHVNTIECVNNNRANVRNEKIAT